MEVSSSFALVEITWMTIVFKMGTNDFSWEQVLLFQNILPILEQVDFEISIYVRAIIIWI